jgi:hypothetical protein
MGIPVIEQTKIQAQILVPLVKALQAELGEERANALVRRALGDIYRRYGEEFWRRSTRRIWGGSWHQRLPRSPVGTPLTIAYVSNARRTAFSRQGVLVQHSLPGHIDCNSLLCSERRLSTDRLNLAP